MRVAMTVWQERISPLFDASQWLRVVDVNDGEMTSRTVHIGEPPKIETVKDLRPDILICGAITRPVYLELLRADIAVHPFICGSAEEVLQGCLRDRNLENRFAMPGYGRRWRGRNRRRGGRQAF